MRPVIVLTLVAFTCTLLLAMVSEATKEPIRLAQEAQKRKAIEALFDFKLKEVIEIEGREALRVVGSSGEKALVIESSTSEGYSGMITAVVGVRAGLIQNYNILTHTETPGLGDKISKEGSFKSQFTGKSLDGFVWRVKKDGGDVDGITAATISSRAISHMLEKALRSAQSLGIDNHDIDSMEVQK